jgi:hypothetical protein
VFLIRHTARLRATGAVYKNGGFIHNVRRLTPWNRGFGKLMVAEVVKKFPVFYGTRKFITVFTTARHSILF